MPILDSKLVCVCGHTPHINAEGQSVKCGATITGAGPNGEDMTCECSFCDTAGELVVTDLEPQAPAGEDQTANDPNNA